MTTALVVLPAVFGFWFGQKPDQVETVQLRSDFTVTAVTQDLRSAAVYGVVDYRTVVRLDLKAGSARRVFVADRPVLDLAVNGDVAVLGLGYEGRLQARTLVNGSVLWNARTASGFRGLAVGRDQVTVVTPADRTVRGFSLTSGAPTQERKLSGTPWDITTSGGDVIVAVVDKAQLVDLDAASLAIRHTIQTLPTPTGVCAAGGTLWAYSALKHQLVPAGGTPRGPWSGGVWTENQRQEVQSNGTSLAVLGRESVSILQPDGSIRRELLMDTPVRSMLLLRDGSVLTISGSKVSVVLP